MTGLKLSVPVCEHPVDRWVRTVLSEDCSDTVWPAEVASDFIARAGFLNTIAYAAGFGSAYSVPWAALDDADRERIEAWCEAQWEYRYKHKHHEGGISAWESSWIKRGVRQVIEWAREDFLATDSINPKPVPRKDPKPRKPRKPRTCEFPGCDRKHLANGLCDTHNHQRARGYTLKPIRAKRPRTCTVQGCDRKHYALGYCGLHWSRMRRHGTTDLPERPVIICNCGCGTKAIKRGMCNNAYQSWLKAHKRAGKPLPPIQPAREATP